MQMKVSGISIFFFFAFMVLTVLITYLAGKANNYTGAVFCGRWESHSLAKWLGARRGFLIGCRTPRHRRHHHRERFRWTNLFDRVARRLADYVVFDC